MALAPTAAAPPPSPVLDIDHRCWICRLAQLYGFLVVGLGAVTHHTLCSSGPVLVSASCTYPVLLMSVESVSVIVFLTGVHRGVQSGTTACIGA